MTLNLLVNILMTVFMAIAFVLMMMLLASPPKSLYGNNNNTISYIWSADIFVSLVMVVIFGTSAKNTNVRVESETIPIVKVTNSHYAIRKNGNLEYHKLPYNYQTTSGKSRIEKTKAIDWYLISKNQDQIDKSKIYINNK